MEVGAAVLAVAHAGAGPAIAEDAIHLVEADDLLGDLGHELEVVGAERAGDPQLGHGTGWRRLLPSASTAIQSGWASIDILVGGVRIGAGDHDHVELAAAGDQLAEGVAIAEPLAAVVERDFGGVVGDAAAGAEAGGVGVGAAEVVEPEGEVELPGSSSTRVSCAQRMGRSNQPSGGCGGVGGRGRGGEGGGLQEGAAGQSGGRVRHCEVRGLGGRCPRACDRGVRAWRWLRGRRGFPPSRDPT